MNEKKKAKENKKRKYIQIDETTVKTAGVLLQWK